MARYRIHYLKESRRQAFRDAAPAPGPVPLKQRDYEPGEEIEADTPYAAWQQWRQQQRPIAVGDALESEAGALLVCKYVGFEEACWRQPPPAEPPGATPDPSLRPG